MAGFDIGSVYAKVDADISGFKKGMDQAQDIAGSAGKGIGRIGDVIKDVANQATIMTGIVSTGLGMLAKNAIDSTSAFEQNRIAFEVLLQDTEKAKKLMKDISDFAMKTPFELPQLVEGSKRLLAYNIEAEKIIPTMEMLGNITAGIGTEKMPQLITAYGQVKAATKLTGAELRQFSEAGVPLLEALVNKANEAGGVLTSVGGASKETTKKMASLASSIANTEFEMNYFKKTGGKTDDQLKAMQKTLDLNKAKLNQFGDVGQAVYKRVKVTAEEMIDKISDGAIKFKDVESALSGMTGEGGKFYDLMKKQSGTFGGVMSNIRDEIGRTMRSIMGMDVTGDIAEGSIFARLKSIAEQFLMFLQQNTSAFTDKFNQAVSSVSYWIGVLVEKMTPLGEWVKNNQELVLTFIKGLGVGFSALLVLGTVNMLLVAFLNPLTLVALAIAGLYNAWETNFGGIQNITKAVLDWFLNTFYPEFNNFWNNYIKPIISNLVNYIKDNWDVISGTTNAVWKVISGFVQFWWSIIYNLIKAGLALFTSDWVAFWDAIAQLTDGAGQGIKKMFNGWIEFVKTWGVELGAWIRKPFDDAYNAVAERMEGIKNLLDPKKRNSPSMVDRVQSGVEAVNRALSGLAVGVDFSPSLKHSSSQPTNSSMVNVRIDMAGAFIGDEYSASSMAESMGDSIIKKLQSNLRI